MRANLRVLGVTMFFFLFVLGNPANVEAIDFAAAQSYPVGTNPSAVVVGDFNGDGKLDIAVANTGSSNVSILLGNGDGTFRPAVNFAAGNSPTAIAVGDFNGDGRLDLAAFQRGANGVAGSVGILLGNGDGTFQAPKTLALQDAAASLMAVADFNLDRKSDLAVEDGGHVVIYIGNGDGTFQPAIGVSAPGADGRAMAVGDFNGDSKPDLAVTVSDSGILILLGNGDGTFVSGATVKVVSVPATVDSVATADLNHDGKADLLIGSSESDVTCGPQCTATLTKISVFLGNGDGSFQGERIAASALSRGRFSNQGFRIDRPFLGDFNGDGKSDLIYRITTIVSGSPTSASLDIRLGRGDGTFPWLLSSGLENVNPFAGSIVVAQDLKADKLTDLIAVGGANDIEMLLNTSPASGADLDIVSSGASAQTVGVGTNLTYTADLLNLGAQDATGVTFTDTLPNNVNFVSAAASQGSCVQSNGIVHCNAGALASAFDFTVSIVVTPTMAGTIINSINVTANEPDPVPTNNTATQTTTVAPVFKLTVTNTGNGSGTVTTPDGGINCGTTCTAMYLSGTGLQVNETPNANSVFAGWSGACSGTGACAVTMSADMTVTANFVLGEKLSVALAGSGSGSVTSRDGGINCANSGGNCSSLYLPGTTVSLTAAPAAPSVFGGWSGACTGSDPNACSIAMNSVQSVTATFNPPPPDFAISPATSSLTVSRGGQGTDVLNFPAQGGFSGTIALVCSVAGTSPKPTCGIAPQSVIPGNTSTLTINAGGLSATAALLPFERGGGFHAAWLPMGMIAGVLAICFDKKRRGRWLLCFVVLVATILPVACGGGSSQPVSQTFTVTVTATSGAIQHSTPILVTVQ